MAGIKFSRSEFEKEIKITPELIEKISSFGTPVESVNDEIIEIEVFPNRPDLLSLQGFLRAIKAFIGKEEGLKKYTVRKPEKDYKLIIDNSVKNVRPFTACAIVKGLTLNNEKIKIIIDLQEKLHSTLGRNRKKLAIGVYPLDKISFPVSYEARSPEKIIFTPLDSVKPMSALEILKKHPTGKEYAHLLEDKKKFPVFVDSKGNILSMPPIINSESTGRVSESTKDVFIECSGFSLSILQKVINIIITTLADMGGKIYSIEMQYDSKIISPDLKEDKMKVSLDNANKILGLKLKEKDLEKLLPKMGYEYSKGQVKIPAWRTDILHEIDIIEDIAIAYGYDNFVPELPNLSTIGEESRESKVKREISILLAGLGLIENSSYHLIKLEEAKAGKIEEKIELESSKTDYKLLRTNLLVPALRIISENKDHEYPQKTFEIGTVFSLGKNEETGITEKENLIVTCSPSNFTEMKQIVDYLFHSLNMNYDIKEENNPLFIDGRTGSIMFNSNKIGYLGEIHPETLREWGIKMPVSALEISLSEIIKSLS